MDYVKINRSLLSCAILSALSMSASYAETINTIDVTQGDAILVGTTPYEYKDRTFSDLIAGYTLAKGTSDSTKGNAESSKFDLTVINTTINGSLFAGRAYTYSGEAKANQNSLKIAGGKAGYAAASYLQADFGTAIGNDNKVTADNTSGRAFIGSQVSIGKDKSQISKIESSGNSIELNNTASSEFSVASLVTVANNANAKIDNLIMNNNNVEIENQEGVSQNNHLISAATFHYYGTDSVLNIPNIQAQSNTVTVSGITSNDVYAVNFSNLSGNSTNSDPFQYSKAAIKGNTLTISDSKITKGIGAALIQENDGYADVTNNEVHIKDIEVGEGVYGAAFLTGDRKTFKDIDQGNSIFAEGINKAGTIGGFDRLNLIVGNQNYSSLTEGVQSSKAVITLTGDNHNVDLSSRTLSLGAASGFSMPKDGYFNLIHVEGNSTLIVPEKSKITFEDTFKATSWDIVDGLEYKQGETFALSFEYNPQTPVDPVDPESPPPLTPSEQKATGNATTLARASLGAASLIGIGLEYIADEGINMMTDAAYHDGNNVFAAVYGSTNDYKGHADFNLDSSTAIVGISTKKNNTVVSAFFEASDGNFSSDLSSAHTSADMQAYDVGTAVRFMADNPFYIDASFRLGVVKTDFDGHFSTESVSYNSDRVFQSLHGALGYDLELSDALSLDNYARYSFIHIEDDDIKLHDKSGTDLQLDDVNSQAFRIGSRLKGYFGDNRLGSFRVGLAYEKVFEGKADAKVDGLKVNAPDLKGDIGILEVGIAKRPTADSPWGVDLTAKGYAGDREGLYGSATLNYVFF